MYFFTRWIRVFILIAVLHQILSQQFKEKQLLQNSFYHKSLLSFMIYPSSNENILAGSDLSKVSQHDGVRNSNVLQPLIQIILNLSPDDNEWYSQLINLIDLQNNDRQPYERKESDEFLDHKRVKSDEDFEVDIKYVEEYSSDANEYEYFENGINHIEEDDMEFSEEINAYDEQQESDPVLIDFEEQDIKEKDFDGYNKSEMKPTTTQNIFSEFKNWIFG